jgi:glycosyltransferase involved in cell wall biosynthesis
LSSCGTVSAVSVVIPTCNRSALLKRAIDSALDQTRPPLELIVVVDGPDPATTASLSCFSDSRIRIIALDEVVGGAEARNIGVRRATGEWIAFLDDDDEWLPNKLELQMASAEKVKDCSPIISCKVIARSGDRTDVWPLKSPVKPYSEYLLVRRRIRYGEGLLQTSTLVARRELLLRVPFRKGLRKHQDWDLILRSTELDEVRIVFVEEPLAIWHLDDNRKRVSQHDNWQCSLDWIHSMKHLVTRRAYASFLANSVARQAAAAGAWRAAPLLFVEMMREGRPGMLDIALLVSPWLVPTSLARLLRRMLVNRRSTDGQLACEEG